MDEILFLFFFFWRGHKLYAGGTKFLNTSLYILYMNNIFILLIIITMIICCK
jgi:hypothetical protein